MRWEGGTGRNKWKGGLERGGLRSVPPLCSSSSSTSYRRRTCGSGERQLGLVTSDLIPAPSLLPFLRFLLLLRPPPPPPPRQAPSRPPPAASLSFTAGNTLFPRVCLLASVPRGVPLEAMENVTHTGIQRLCCKCLSLRKGGTSVCLPIPVSVACH